MGCVSMPVRYPSELKRGDHIMWKRPLVYDHHAIVERVNGNKVHVIEFGSPGGGSSSGKGKVCRHKIDGVDKMYRYVYDVCDDPDTVLQRARAKVGEKLWSEIWYKEYMKAKSVIEKGKCVFLYCISKISESIGIGGYNPLWNNCEHVARMCKTGIRSCCQISSFWARSGIALLAAAFGGSATAVSRFVAVCKHEGLCPKSTLKEIWISRDFARLKAIINRGGSECGKNVDMLGMKLRHKAGILGITAGIIEGILFCWNWYKATRQYNQRMNIAEDDEDMQERIYEEWKKDMIEAGAEATGGVAGAVIGGLIGSVVPVYGTAIGAAVGSQSGRMSCRAFARWFNG